MEVSSYTGRPHGSRRNNPGTTETGPWSGPRVGPDTADQRNTVPLPGSEPRTIQRTA